MARIVWIAALIAGLSYVLAGYLGVTPLGGTVWKGAGVGLIALWCALHARGRDGWLITVIMALGALGDVLFETHGMFAAAAAFGLGHIVAIGFYLAKRRTMLRSSQAALGVALFVGAPLISWLLTRDGAAAGYALLLGGMAASAWTSRFPRYRTGIGAVMFVISDWLIFARAAGHATGDGLNAAVWLLYFGGQALIAWGVVSKLTSEQKGIG